MTTTGRKVFIKTYGCQMNVYDSERMADALRPSGYSVTDTAENADLILLNTCHIREKAAEKTYHELGRLRDLKDAKPDLKIGVTGCVAQAEGAEILRRSSLVDLVAGPQSYFRLPELEAAAQTGARVVDTDFPTEDKFDKLPARRHSAQPSAFVTVQEGCDKFCAFCVVPYTRGAEVSRPVARVLDEIRALAASGVHEVTLLGQNVNGYHGEGDNGPVRLAGLIARIADLPGIARIRYTTSHPNDMSDDLIDLHGTCDKLMPYLHLPVQSGSDRVLKAMNRKHDIASYRRLIDKIRNARPDILLSSDFIVGFPGESDADFAASLALVAEIGFGMAYSFKYSARPGTPAAEKPPLPDGLVDERLQLLQAAISREQYRVQDDMVGKVVSVLFERQGRNPGQVTGKSGQLHPVFVDDAGLSIGDIRDVRVTRALTNSLEGVLV